MRNLFALIAVLAACGSEPETARNDAPPPDGFLALLPDNASVTVRVPPPGALGAFERLARAFGHGTDAAYLVSSGLDPERAGCIVATADGRWMRCVPAADRGQVNAELRELAGRVAVREAGEWTVLGTATEPAPEAAAPLPAGDVALRVVHHPLLNAVAEPGDRLELGATLLPGGVTRDRPPRSPRGRTTSPTADAFARAGDEVFGRIDLLPAWMAVRVETSIPPARLASNLARRIGRHAGLDAGDEVDNIERFLREAATALDASTGYAFGFDCKEGALRLAIVGRVADGPPSPVLARLSRDVQSEFGGLVVETRETNSKSRTGFHVWVPQAKPKTEGLPETAMGLFADLINGDVAVTIAHGQTEGIAVLTAGRDADSLARAILRTVREGMSRSSGGSHLVDMKQKREAPCVWSAIVAPRRLASLAASDRATLGAWLHAGDAPELPRVIAVGAFREPDGIGVEAVVVYGP